MNVVSPSLRTTMSSVGVSWSALVSQKVAWLPPIMVVAFGCISWAMLRSVFALLYSSVVAVMPMMSLGIWLMRLRNAS